MNKVCFATVVFEANLKYFKAFLGSLEMQSDKLFTLLVFNDGVKELESFFEAYKLPYVIIEVDGTIGEVRTKLFAYLKASDFTSVIFGDSDDTFEFNRVEVTKALLKDFDIVANDVSLMTQDGTLFEINYWEDREEVLKNIDFSTIENYNFLGLGNTAVRIDALPETISFSEDIIAIDWMLFSQLLLADKSATFTSQTTTHYRQHEENIVGRKELTLEGIKRILSVKSSHYENLAKLLPEMLSKATKYKTLLSGVDHISEEEILKKSLKINTPFWWEEIQL